MSCWGVATVDQGDLPRPKLTDLCSCMNAVDRDYTIIIDMTRHRISGEHFSFSDNFTYPVC